MHLPMISSTRSTLATATWVIAISGFAALSGLAGCAAPEQTTVSGAAPTPKICDREYRVGSNIPNRDCRPAMTDEERQRNIDDIRNGLRPAPGHAITGSGG